MDQICAKEGFMGCISQSNDEICDAVIFLLLAWSKYPIDWEHLSWNLAILNITYVGRECVLVLSDDFVCVFIRNHWAHLAKYFHQNAKAPVCILHSLCKYRLLESILELGYNCWRHAHEKNLYVFLCFNKIVDRILFAQHCDFH